jgi:glucose dehydrogenase
MLKVALLLGLALVVVGGALVPLPGPGYPVLLAGLGVTIIAGIVLVHDRTHRT